MSTITESMDTLAFSWTANFVPSTLIVVIFVVTFYFWQQSRPYYRMGNALPGPPPLPFIGNILEIPWSPENVLLKAIQYGEKYGNLVRGWFGPILVVFLMEPADIEIILGSSEHIDKSEEYRFFKPWLGEGLLISTGEKWRSHRKMIAPAFHMNVLKSFVDVFNVNSQNVVKNMRKELGKTFDCHDYLSGVTVDILLETAMGITRSTQDNSGFEYAKAVMKMCDIIHRRHVNFCLRMDSIFKWTSFGKKQEQFLKVIHGLTSKVIQLKKQEYENNQGAGDKPSYYQMLDYQAEQLDKKHERKANVIAQTGLRDDLDDMDENDVGEKKRLAFLDLMIETAQNSGNLTDHEIKEEVDTIMFEGHDTTAAGSSFVLCLLGIHTGIQDKVYEELYEIFGNSDRPVTYHDTLEMNYLERVIMETLRLYPPVPIIARKLRENVKLASGNYMVPAGCTIVIGTYKLHRREDLYPNAEVFDPDNFLPERTKGRHYYSYIPFSAGPRSCVGRKYAMLKLKVLLATILRSYRIVSDLKEKDFRLLADIILKRADGFKIQIELRNPKLPTK